ncbi:S-adenosyl-L-methionine-dependent methyltransferases superfamily protein [Hibiscus syriacus]|uniref:S-adenosyl-L-methionine-dependent methyltransferases superfamily protein n=1 Tax=Hibiscus syriacus TaxID=106335 RepID=A0A6A2WWW5_HIBSY|nr:protein PHYTOCHROME KINASE SUBSTRATE 3-like [Hibiscus syriacus]KAE8666038.1 S-adenosyl-L-methionine-dependent methyltransferases superfamily protein [Hibiscus syriacus]
MFETMDGEKRKTTGLGEVSFSSYRSTAEEIFVHKIAEPRLTRNKRPEGEISVFGAEKYFNTRFDDDDDDGDGDDRFSNKRDDPPHQTGPRRWPGTPSASSEASWSSQSVLLRSFMKDRSINKKKRVDGRSFLANLSCTGSCSNGKSVYVNQDVDRGRVHVQEVNKKSIRPRFSPKDEINRMKVCSVPRLETQLDDPRKSLEVFGSTAMKKGDVTKNLERKLSMLTWDAIPKAPSVSSISRTNRMDDDAGSDCSSDLFEINNIDGDGPYAPSETSVEWSVVTAGAADSSFVSDYDEKKSKTVSRASNAAKEAQRSRSGGILGCKSHKAVMVVETAYTKSPNIIDS